METLRSWILGSSTPSGSSNHEKQATERSKVLLQQQQQQQQNATEPERLATLARAQTIQLGQLMDECNEIEEQLAVIDPIKERTRALHLIQQKKQVKAEAESMSQKLENTRRQQKILDEARKNVEQQKALQESAVELAALAIVAKTVDIRETREVINDASKDLDDIRKELEKPMFVMHGGKSSIVEQDEAEQELAALMAKHHLPSVPTTTVTTAAPAAATVVEEVSPPEAEEKLKAN